MYCFFFGELKFFLSFADINNRPGWLIPESEYKTASRVPVFVKPLLLDVTKQENKVCPLNKSPLCVY